MIPNNNSDLITDFEFEEAPSKTLKLDISNQTISGYADEIEAVKQAIYLILNIERYENLIYSWDYGIELRDLFGKDINYILPELKRRITEALLQDSRITDVSDFDFKTLKGKVHVTFMVQTIFGEAESEKVVSI